MRAVPVILLVLLAGCMAQEPSETEDRDGDGFTDAIEEKFGSDIDNATSQPEVVRSKAVEFRETTQVVGTGVPTVQCPADQVNSKVLTWSVTAETGDAREAWVSDLSFTVTGAMTVNDVDLFVYDPSGSPLGSATSGENAETVTVGGKRPLGDYSIEARGCSGAGDVEVAASGTVHWIPSDAELLATAA